MTEDNLRIRLTSLERAVELIASDWMPAIKNRLAELERTRPKTDETRTYRRNWKDYVALKALRERGLTVRAAAREMGLSYSTAHNYKYLSADEIDKLRSAWEKAHGPLPEGDVSC